MKFLAVPVAVLNGLAVGALVGHLLLAASGARVVIREPALPVDGRGEHPDGERRVRALLGFREAHHKLPKDGRLLERERADGFPYKVIQILREPVAGPPFEEHFGTLVGQLRGRLVGVLLPLFRQACDEEAQAMELEG